MRCHGRVTAYAFVLMWGCQASGCHSDDTATDAQAPVAAPTTKPSTVSMPTSADAADKAAPEPEPSPGPPVRKDGTIYADTELMGTRVSLNVWLSPDKTAVQAGAAMEAALAAMVEVDEHMSEWSPVSELSQLSAAAGGEPKVVTDDLFAVLERAKTIAEDSDGAFDPTFHGVGQLWRFTADATPPTAAQIKAKLALVGHDKLHLDATAKTAQLQRAGMKLGLGAIAKGFAVDKASSVLASHGFANHVVEAGGDTYAAGTKAGKPWAVGIQTPGQKGVVGALPTSNRAVVTSGDYQRFFEHEGKRYAHILDPKTGWPVPAERSPRSVTLVANNATDADAYATAVAVLGVEAGLAFVEARPDLEAVVIDGAAKVHISTGLRDEIMIAD